MHNHAETAMRQLEISSDAHRAGYLHAQQLEAVISQTPQYRPPASVNECGI
jgi:hypothetical protein